MTDDILSIFINSEHPDDIARARADCAACGIDYAAARAAKLREMAAEGRALMARQASGESRAEKYRPIFVSAQSSLEGEHDHAELEN